MSGSDQGKREQRKKLLELLLSGMSSLDRYTESTTPLEALHYRPPLDDAWTIMEHMGHILDVEVSGYVFIRKAIVEPGVETWGFPHDDWIEPLRYADLSMNEVLAAFKSIRLLTYRLLKDIEDEGWDGFYLLRSSGEKRTLDRLLEILAGHVDFHLEYLERNLAIWKEKNV
jgi:hypothetical protein